MFLSSLIEQYGASPFVIDCHDIEVHEQGWQHSLIFKGPGSLESNSSGKISYKLHNQIPFGSDKIPILKRLAPYCKDKPLVAMINACDYQGTKWGGGFTVPRMSMYDLDPSQQFMVYGEFSQLTVRIEKADGDTKHDMTELIFPGQLKLPYAERYQETTHRGKDKVSTKWPRGYHQLDYKGTAITFEESEDQKFTRVLIQHRDEFKPPCVENWVSEALRFVTAKLFHPRMVIRHFDNDALVFIRETYSDVTTGILSPFHGKFHIEKDAWEGFYAYLSKCEENNTWEFMKISDSFSELMAASTGTVQGLLISLSTYIEGVIKEIYRDKANGIKDCVTPDKLSELQSYVKEWKDYGDINTRINGLLSMLTKPPTSTYLRDLVDRKVVKEFHQEVWSKVRNKLAHGGLIGRSRENDFWHYSHHLICMAHRLTLSFIGYQGRVLNYDNDAGYGLEEFKWDSMHENEDSNANNPSQKTE